MVIATYALTFVVGLASISMLGCAILAYFTDYEAAGSAGCIPPGQVW